jgi:hypothetical protein
MQMYARTQQFTMRDKAQETLCPGVEAGIEPDPMLRKMGKIILFVHSDAPYLKNILRKNCRCNDLQKKYYFLWN